QPSELAFLRSPPNLVVFNSFPLHLLGECARREKEFFQGRGSEWKSLQFEHIPRRNTPRKARFVLPNSAQTFADSRSGFLYTVSCISPANELTNSPSFLHTNQPRRLPS